MGAMMPTERHVLHDDHMPERPLLLREFIQGLITLSTHVHPRSPQPLQPVRGDPCSICGLCAPPNPPATTHPACAPRTALRRFI